MLRNDDVWMEGEQRVRRRGMVIVTTKPALIRASYGNERVRELQEQRSRRDAVPKGRFRRLFSRRSPSGNDGAEPLRDGVPAGAPEQARGDRAEPTPAPAPEAAAPRAEPKRRTGVDSPVLRKIGECWKTLLQQRHTLGHDHPMTAITMHRLACLCHEAERFDDAAKWFHLAHTVWTKHLGPNHPSVARNLRKWAELMRSQGFDAEALRLHGLAEKIQREPQVA